MRISGLWIQGSEDSPCPEVHTVLKDAARTHHGERAGVETVITCHRRPKLAWEPVGHQGRFKFLLWNLFQAFNALYSHKSQIIT